MRRLVLLATLLALGACQYPRDPDGTLERVRGGTLRVGITEQPPWTRLPPGGVEPALVERFARTLDARVQWRQGSEAELVASLEEGELDLVVGGLTNRSPWKKHVALTRPYLDDGGERHVMATPLGENAFVGELESFLLDHEADARRLLEESRP